MSIRRNLAVLVACVLVALAVFISAPHPGATERGHADVPKPFHLSGVLVGPSCGVVPLLPCQLVGK